MASKTAVRKKYQPHLDGQSSAGRPLPVMRAPWADSTLSLLREERDSSNSLKALPEGWRWLLTDS